MQPGPRHVPPAVVVYLTNGGNVTHEVFKYAVLALVADGWLQIEPQDAGVAVVRVNRLPEPSQVTQFEQLVVDRVVHCTGAAPHVPLSALTTDDGDDYTTWWTRFEHTIKDEVRAAGLTKQVLNPFVGCLIPVGFTVAAPAVTAILAHSVVGAAGAGIAALVIALIFAISMVHTEPTKQGKAAIAWWRRRGGGLSGVVIADRLPPARPRRLTAPSRWSRGTVSPCRRATCGPGTQAGGAR